MDELTSVDLTLFSNVEMVFFGLLGSVCHKDDGQGTDRDTQTGLAGKGCIFCSLWSVQRSSAARHNVLELHFLGETMRREEVWGRVFFCGKFLCFRATLVITGAHPPCLQAAGWMSAGPSSSWLAVCWSSSSWNQESQRLSFFLLCHSKFAVNRPFKLTKRMTWITVSGVIRLSVQESHNLQKCCLNIFL